MAKALDEHQLIGSLLEGKLVHGEKAKDMETLKRRIFENLGENSTNHENDKQPDQYDAEGQILSFADRNGRNFIGIAVVLGVEQVGIQQNFH